ncbi:hypothetical protein CYY_004728 [Polysphondylium violaceum]|uniref:Uncharacterized protein n=1 Tax=Polysphondylium violaceum TaxID=133409 RepID=A0A8J4PSY1_9MYCE|nr:hypothetical protein CYY_004728 [Polysphondylium violaceum]
MSTSNLKSLTLRTFNHPIQVDVLPISLQVLYLDEYNHPLKASVLPNGLKSLYIYALEYPLEKGSLPSSLTSISMVRYQSSFESVAPLNLSHLFVSFIDPSISKVLSNVQDISIKTNEISPLVSLKSTSIQNLCLSLRVKTPIHTDLLPLSLRKLRLQGMTIPSSAVIPKSCFYLKTDIKDLDPTSIPKSVRYNIFSGVKKLINF